VILTRLGVDLAEQGRGLGAALVRDALERAATAAASIGIRALLIHAESQRAAAFCRRIDPAFQPSPVEPLHLVLLMKDIRAALLRAAVGPSGERDDRAVSDG
jgi:GNAT superfamily N-acetyltransferase